MISKEELGRLIKRIKDATGLRQEEISLGAGYKTTTLTEILSKGKRVEAAYKRLELIYGEKLKNSISIEEPIAEPAKKDKFTAEQLFTMFMKTAERQDRIIEAQTVILTNIESKMAQEKTQAIIAEKIGTLDLNLIEALSDLDKISDTQNRSIGRVLEEFSGLKKEINSLREANKRKD